MGELARDAESGDSDRRDNHRGDNCFFVPPGPMLNWWEVCLVGHKGGHNPECERDSFDVTIYMSGIAAKMFALEASLVGLGGIKSNLENGNMFFKQPPHMRREPWGRVRAGPALRAVQRREGSSRNQQAERRLRGHVAEDQDERRQEQASCPEDVQRCQQGHHAHALCNMSIGARSCC